MFSIPLRPGRLRLPFLRQLILAMTISSSLFAQFGGSSGDAVIYAVTAGGSGDFRVAGPSAVNSASGLAAFRTISLASVPVRKSTPFPLDRQVFYETPAETFAVGTDAENTVGLHKLFLFPVKTLELEGTLRPFPGFVGGANTFINFPRGLDTDGDISFETELVAIWFPGSWPFVAVTTERSSLGPAYLTGFQYLFQIPGGVGLPGLLPWANMSRLYPGAGWPSGADLKMLDVDPALGTTIRQIRIRGGSRTPVFAIPGHTHLLVLQGKATLAVAGGTTTSLNKYDYAYLPENLAVSVTVPVPYTGPRAK